MRLFHNPRLAALCAFILLTLGCAGPERPSGTVAEVNGKPIGYRELEAVRASMYSGASSLSAIPGDAELRIQYTRALRQIIFQELAAQELERQDKQPDPAELDRMEAEIRKDYPPEAYTAMLEEQGLDETLVRLMLRRRLDMEQYVAKVLRPEIGVTPEEVQAYYEAHKQDFVIPEQWHYLQISAPAKGDAEAAGRALQEGTPPAEAQKDFGGILREVRTAKASLPEDVRVALERQGLRVAGAAMPAEGGFRVLILLDKTPETQLDPGTVAARVEAALMEEKVPATLERMLEKRLAKYEIHIAEPLLREAAQPAAPAEKDPPARNSSLSDPEPPVEPETPS